MRLTIIGCGDAFGSGGRLQTSLHVRSGASTFLIDCGASSLIGMHRLGLSRTRSTPFSSPICMATISADCPGS